MITNNLGTLIYSFLYGKKVGEDKNGNKFYIHKKNDKKKWVIYKKIVDPTSLMVIWQLWLTNKKPALPSDLNTDTAYKWQKEKLPNYSGTKESYHPRVSKNSIDKTNKDKQSNEIWRPK